MIWTLRSWSLRCPLSHVSRSQYRSFSLKQSRWTEYHGPQRILPAPSFREQVSRTGELESFSEKVKRPSVGNQVLIFAFGSFVVFCAAARLTNNDTFRWSNIFTDYGSAWKSRLPNNEEMRRIRYYSFGKKLQDGLAAMKDAVEEWPQTLKALMIWTYVQVAQPILDMSEGRRVAWFIATINGAVYIAWQFPRLKPFMTRHFTHDPLSGLSYTLLTSMFSHRSLLHLLVNSMILSTFGSATTQWFAEETQKDSENLRESTSKWHFIAFFISAGLFSGLVSHIVSARVTFPRLVSRLTSSTAPGNSKTLTASITKNRPFKNAAKEQSLTIPPSLGSSGAVYSTLVVVAMAYPDTELALKIPPAFPIPIQYGVGTLLAVDILGALRGWRYFNHWAHLGGAAFGAFYWEYGFELWDLLRVITLGNLPPSLSKTQVQ